MRSLSPIPPCRRDPGPSRDEIRQTVHNRAFRVAGPVRDISQVSERRTHVAPPHANQVTPTRVSGVMVHPAYVPSLLIP
jgi:hypothetical protein